MNPRKVETVSEIANAIQSGLQYVMLNDMAIKLPSPQTSGTSYQKRAYAELKAREILETSNTK